MNLNELLVIIPNYAITLNLLLLKACSEGYFLKSIMALILDFGTFGLRPKVPNSKIQRCDLFSFV